MTNQNIKTKRLILSPMTTEQLEVLIEKTEDDVLKAAYSEMLNGVQNHAGKEKWYTNWTISLKESGIIIGGICFKGEPNQSKTVEIGYGINDEYQGKGFATEAIKAIMEWAFSQNDCYYIQAQTDENNIASQRVLEKNEFKKLGDGTEGLLWELEKPQSSWMSLYMCIGLSLGLCFGQMLYENSYLGMPIGMMIGVAIGAGLDAQDKKNRKK